MSGELADLGLAEAAEVIRAKELSPVEYATALLDRIECHDNKYNAFIALTPERALKAARAAEAEITAGRWRGPFHGAPYALNDIIDVEGLATTAHSKILEGNIARRHAVVTERLEAAGGVLLGKLSTHEFAIGGPSFDLPWPPARNPWNRDHFCGGSSSGSGAGLAADWMHRRDAFSAARRARALDRNPPDPIATPPRSSTPQAKAPCPPPPGSARLTSLRPGEPLARTIRAGLRSL